MRLFSSKPTKQDIFISATIFLCGILFAIGISNFKGIGKDIDLNIESERNRSDTTLFYLVYDSTRKCNIVYTYNPGIKNTIVHYYSLEKGIMKSDTIFIKKDSITYSDSLAIFSLVDELKAREGYRDTIYWSIDYDKVKRAYTGYGHQMRKKDWKVLKFPLKREQVDSMLWADIKSAYWYHRDLDRKRLKKNVKSIFISGKE